MEEEELKFVNVQAFVEEQVEVDWKVGDADQDEKPMFEKEDDDEKAD